jgi:hypothetical protein
LLNLLRPRKAPEPGICHKRLWPLLVGGSPGVNGESSVHIDRGQWLYRFALDSGNIAIYRARRCGQDLTPTEAWRCLAVVGICDAFIVPAGGGWQPFIELGEGRQRWALERRGSFEEAEQAARHFLASMADAIAHAAPLRGGPPDKDSPDGGILRAPLPPSPPVEDPEVEDALAQACAEREAAGWELIYSRQRALR